MYFILTSSGFNNTKYILVLVVVHVLLPSPSLSLGVSFMAVLSGFSFLLWRLWDPTGSLCCEPATRGSGFGQAIDLRFSELTLGMQLTLLCLRWGAGREEAPTEQSWAGGSRRPGRLEPGPCELTSGLVTSGATEHSVSNLVRPRSPLLT